MGKGKKKKKSKIDSDWDEEDPLKGEKSRKGGKKKDKKRKKGDSAGGNGLVVALVIAVALAAAYFMGWLPGSKTRPGATSDQSREGAGGATETQGYEESVADTKYSFGCEQTDPACCDPNLLAQVEGGCNSLGVGECGVFTGCCEWSDESMLCETIYIHPGGDDGTG